MMRGRLESGVRFEEAGAGLASRFEETLFMAVRDERPAVQVQPVDVESSDFAQSLKRAILLFDHVRRPVIPKGVQDALGRVGLPAVALEFVAGVATVHPVFRFIPSAPRARLEVIHGELRSRVAFADSQ
jgi:hypothetical protein